MDPNLLIGLAIGFVVGGVVLFFTQKRQLDQKEKEIKKLNQQLDNSEREHQSRMEQTIESIQQESREQSAQTIENLDRQNQEQFRELEQSHQTRIQELEQSHQSRIRELEQSHQARIQELEQSHQSRLQEETERVKQEYEGRLASIEQSGANLVQPQAPKEDTHHPTRSNPQTESIDELKLEDDSEPELQGAFLEDDIQQLNDIFQGSPATWEDEASQPWEEDLKDPKKTQKSNADFDLDDSSVEDDIQKLSDLFGDMSFDSDEEDNEKKKKSKNNLDDFDF